MEFKIKERTPLEYVVLALAVAMSVWHLEIAYTGGHEGLFQRTVTYLMGFAMIFIVYRSPKGGLWQNIVSGIIFTLAISSVAYAIYQNQYFLNRLPLVDPITPYDFFFGSVCLLLTWEATRRTINNALPILSIFFVLYTYYGPYFPWELAHRGDTLDRIIDHQYMLTDGLWTLPIGVFSIYIFLFILFGAFLERMGAADFYVKLSIAAAGHLRGGPAKAAIFASAMTGSITGSANANIATTGPFTIPLMKRTGFKAETAAGIETAASTGGQIMPPIMGTAAFLIVEFTGIPYWEVIKVSILPAVLYFISVYAIVHFEARKGGLVGMPKNEVPATWPIIKDGWYYLVPLIVIIAIIMTGRPVPQAGTAGILCVIGIAAAKGGWQLYKQSRTIGITFKDVLKNIAYGIWQIFEAMDAAARRSLPILAAVGSVGIIMGVLYQSGLGTKFSSMVVTLSYGSLLLGIIVVGLASFVLGMGLPTSAAYIVLSVMAVPALLELGEPYGLSLLTAHLIVFWFSLDSSFTPPVCVPAYTAAGIAGAQPNKAAWAAFRTAKGMYVVPLMFGFTPILLLGEPFPLAETFIAATLGFMALAAGIVGFLYVKAGVAERFVLGAAACLMFWPGWWLHLIGAAIFAVMFMSQRARYTKEFGAPPTRTA
jgi:TRAP transporter 4TM/12TM fusion protein